MKLWLTLKQACNQIRKPVTDTIKINNQFKHLSYTHYMYVNADIVFPITP